MSTADLLEAWVAKGSPAVALNETLEGNRQPDRRALKLGKLAGRPSTGVDVCCTINSLGNGVAIL